MTKWHRADQLGVKAEQELSQSGAPQRQLGLKVGSRVRLIVNMGGMHNGQCGDVVGFAPRPSESSSVQGVGTFDGTTMWPVVRFHHTSVSLCRGAVLPRTDFLLFIELRRFAVVLLLWWCS